MQTNQNSSFTKEQESIIVKGISETMLKLAMPTFSELNKNLNHFGHSVSQNNTDMKSKISDLIKDGINFKISDVKIDKEVLLKAQPISLNELNNNDYLFGNLPDFPYKVYQPNKKKISKNDIFNSFNLRQGLYIELLNFFMEQTKFIYFNEQDLSTFFGKNEEDFDIFFHYNKRKHIMILLILVRIKNYIECYVPEIKINDTKTLLEHKHILLNTRLIFVPIIYDNCSLLDMLLNRWKPYRVALDAQYLNAGLYQMSHIYTFKETNSFDKKVTLTAKVLDMDITENEKLYFNIL